MKNLRLFELSEEYDNEMLNLPFPCVSHITENQNVEYGFESQVICGYKLELSEDELANIEEIKNMYPNGLTIFTDSTRLTLKSYSINGKKFTTTPVKTEETTETIQFSAQTIDGNEGLLPKSDYAIPLGEFNTNITWEASTTLTDSDYIVLALYSGTTIVAVEPLPFSEAVNTGMFEITDNKTIRLTQAACDELNSQASQMLGGSYAFFFAEGSWIGNGLPTDAPSITTEITFVKVSGGISEITLPIPTQLSTTYQISYIFNDDMLDLSKLNNTELAKQLLYSFDTRKLKEEHSIVDYMFNSSPIKEIYLGNKTTSIGNSAFTNCYSLTSVTIPNSVTSIGDSAFEGCSGLTSIEIPNSVISIGVQAFGYCRSLASIEIPNSVTSIGDLAFTFCSSLTSIEIPNSVTEIGYGVFSSCSGLTLIEIHDSVTSVGSDAFNHCTNLTSVTIGNSVTSIGNSAFYNCTSLTSVTIPNSVTSIGYAAFSNCSSLTSVTIGDSVTSIGGNAFALCSSLTSIEIPDSVTLIGYSAFTQCYNLTSVTFGNSVTSIGNRAFYNCSSLTSIEIPNSVTSIGAWAFNNCTNLTSVTIPNSVTEIAIGAFSDCTSLPIIDNIRYADSYLVEAVDKTLTTYNIKEETKWIEGNAFRTCTKLTSIEIPDSVTSIGGYAFGDCSGLTSVTIGNSVNLIGDSAFRKCKHLTSVTCYAINAPTIQTYTFYNISSNGTLYYPKGSDYSSWISALPSTWTSQEIEV